MEEIEGNPNAKEKPKVDYALNRGNVFNTNGDIFQKGLNEKYDFRLNTSDFYKKELKDHFSVDGKFDENSFDDWYKNESKEYDNFIKGNYDVNNVSTHLLANTDYARATGVPHRKTGNFDVIPSTPDPQGRTYGYAGINEFSDPTKSLRDEARKQGVNLGHGFYRPYSDYGFFDKPLLKYAKDDKGQYKLDPVTGKPYLEKLKEGEELKGTDEQVGVFDNLLDATSLDKGIGKQTLTWIPKTPINLVVSAMQSLQELYKTGLVLSGQGESLAYKSASSTKNIIGQFKIGSSDYAQENTFSYENATDLVGNIAGQLYMGAGVFNGIKALGASTKTAAIGTKLFLTATSAGDISQAARDAGLTKVEAALLHTTLMTGLYGVQGLSEKILGFGDSAALMKSAINEELVPLANKIGQLGEEEVKKASKNILSNFLGKAKQLATNVKGYPGAALEEATEEGLEQVWDVGIRQAYNLYDGLVDKDKVGQGKFNIDYQQELKNLGMAIGGGAIGGVLAKKLIGSNPEGKASMIDYIAKGNVGDFNDQLEEAYKGKSLGNDNIDAKTGKPFTIKTESSVSLNDLNYNALKQQFSLLNTLWNSKGLNDVYKTNEDKLTGFKNILANTSISKDTGKLFNEFVSANTELDRYMEDIANSKVLDSPDKQKEKIESYQNNIDSLSARLDSLRSGTHFPRYLTEGLFKVNKLDLHPETFETLNEIVQANREEKEEGIKIKNKQIKESNDEILATENIIDLPQVLSKKTISTTTRNKINKEIDSKISELTGSLDEFINRLSSTPDQSASLQALVEENGITEPIDLFNNLSYTSDFEHPLMQDLKELTDIKQTVTSTALEDPIDYVKEQDLDEFAREIVAGVTGRIDSGLAYRDIIDGELRDLQATTRDVGGNRISTYSNSKFLSALIKNIDTRLAQVKGITIVNPSVNQAIAVNQLNVPPKIQLEPEQSKIITEQLEGLKKEAQVLHEISIQNGNNIEEIEKDIETFGIIEKSNMLSDIGNLVKENGLSYEFVDKVTNPTGNLNLAIKNRDNNAALRELVSLEYDIHKEFQTKSPNELYDLFNLSTLDSYERGRNPKNVDQLTVKYNYLKSIVNLNPLIFYSNYLDVLKGSIRPSSFQQESIIKQAVAFLQQDKDYVLSNITGDKEIKNSLFIPGIQGSGKTQQVTINIAKLDQVLRGGKVLVAAHRAGQRILLTNSLKKLKVNLHESKVNSNPDFILDHDILIKSLDPTLSDNFIGINTIIYDEATFIPDDKIELIGQLIEVYNKEYRATTTKLKIIYTGDISQLGYTNNNLERNLSTIVPIEKTPELTIPYRTGVKQINAFIDYIRERQKISNLSTPTSFTTQYGVLNGEPAGVRVEGDNFDSVAESILTQLKGEDVAYITDKTNVVKGAFNIMTPTEAQGKSFKYVIVDLENTSPQSGLSGERLILKNLLSTVGRSSQYSLVKIDPKRNISTLEKTPEVVTIDESKNKKKLADKINQVNEILKGRSNQDFKTTEQTPTTSEEVPDELPSNGQLETLPTTEFSEDTGVIVYDQVTNQEVVRNLTYSELYKNRERELALQRDEAGQVPVFMFYNTKDSDPISSYTSRQKALGLEKNNFSNPINYNLVVKRYNANHPDASLTSPLKDGDLFVYLQAVVGDEPIMIGVFPQSRLEFTNTNTLLRYLEEKLGDNEEIIISMDKPKVNPDNLSKGKPIKGPVKTLSEFIANNPHINFSKQVYICTIDNLAEKSLGEFATTSKDLAGQSFIFYSFDKNNQIDNDIINGRMSNYGKILLDESTNDLVTLTNKFKDANFLDREVYVSKAVGNKIGQTIHSIQADGDYAKFLDILKIHSIEIPTPEQITDREARVKDFQYRLDSTTFFSILRDPSNAKNLVKLNEDFNKSKYLKDGIQISPILVSRSTKDNSFFALAYPFVGGEDLKSNLNVDLDTISMPSLYLSIDEIYNSLNKLIETVERTSFPETPLSIVTEEVELPKDNFELAEVIETIQSNNIELDPLENEIVENIESNTFTELATKFFPGDYIRMFPQLVGKFQREVYNSIFRLDQSKPEIVGDLNKAIVEYKASIDKKLNGFTDLIRKSTIKGLLDSSLSKDNYFNYVISNQFDNLIPSLRYIKKENGLYYINNINYKQAGFVEDKETVSGLTSSATDLVKFHLFNTPLIEFSNAQWNYVEDKFLDEGGIETISSEISKAPFPINNIGKLKEFLKGNNDPIIKSFYYRFLSDESIVVQNKMYHSLQSTGVANDILNSMISTLNTLQPKRYAPVIDGELKYGVENNTSTVNQLESNIINKLSKNGIIRKEVKDKVKLKGNNIALLDKNKTIVSFNFSAGKAGLPISINPTTSSYDSYTKALNFLGYNFSREAVGKIIADEALLPDYKSKIPSGKRTENEQFVQSVIGNGLYLIHLNGKSSELSTPVSLYRQNRILANSFDKYNQNLKKSLYINSGGDKVYLLTQQSPIYRVNQSINEIHSADTSVLADNVFVKGNYVIDNFYLKDGFKDAFGKNKSKTKFSIKESLSYNINHLFGSVLLSSNYRKAMVDFAVFSDKPTSPVPLITNNTGEYLPVKDGKLDKARLFNEYYGAEKNHHTELEKVIVSEWNNVLDKSVSNITELDEALNKKSIPIKSISNTNLVKELMYVKSDKGTAVLKPALVKFIKTYTSNNKAAISKYMDDRLNDFVTQLEENEFKISDNLSKEVNKRFNTTPKLRTEKGIHPLIEGYFYHWNTLSSELLRLNVGSIYQYKGQGIPSMFKDQVKRNVMMTSTFNKYVLNTSKGLGNFSKIAIVEDTVQELQAIAYAGVKGQEVYDGASFVLPLTRRLQRNSYGNDFGINPTGNTKPISSYRDPVTGVVKFIKNAEFEITNEILRNGSSMIRNVVRKMLSVPVNITYEGKDYSNFYDLWISLGGYNNDESWDQLYDIVVSQGLKDQFIQELAMPTSIKTGVSNINPNTSLYDEESPLSFIEFNNENRGIQLDATHDPDDQDGNPITQIFNASVLEGRSLTEANNIFDGLSLLAEKGLKNIKLSKTKLKEEVQSLVKDALLTRGESFYELANDGNLALDNKSILSTVQSTLSNYVTKLAIKPKFKGGQFIVSPAYNILQVYDVEGKVMMQSEVERLGINNTNLKTLNLRGRGTYRNTNDINDGNEVAILNSNENSNLLFVQDLESGERYEIYKNQFEGIDQQNTVLKPRNLKWLGYSNGTQSIYDLDEWKNLKNAIDNKASKEEEGVLRAILQEKIENESWTVEPAEVIMPMIFKSKFGLVDGMQVNDVTEQFFKSQGLSNKLAKKKFDSFTKSLNIIAARIPASGKQSFVAMKIVGFINSNKNAMYIPIEMLYYQGADQDIDKGNVISRELDKKGNDIVYKLKDGKLDKSNSEAAIKNYILDNLLAVSLNPNNAIENNLPVTVDNIQSIGRELDVVKEESNIQSGKIDIQLSNTNPASSVIMGRTNMDGKEMTGIFAQALKTYEVLFNTYQSYANKNTQPILNLEFNGKTYNYLSNTLTGDKIAEYAKNQAWKEYSELINAATDNAKEQILGKINANVNTGNLIVSMVSVGIPSIEIFTFLNSEPVVEVFKFIQKSQDFEEDTEFTDINKAIRLAKKKLKIKDKSQEAYILDKLKEFYESGEEFNMLGKTLGINQGLPNSEYSTYRFINNIENYINTQYQKAKLDADFDLLNFIANPNYANVQVNKYKKAKKLYNILYVINTNPHFLSYLKALEVKEGIVSQLTYIPNKTKSLIKSIQPFLGKFGERKVLNENQYKAAQNHIYSLVVDSLLKDTVTELDGVSYNLGMVADRSNFIRQFSDYINLIKEDLQDNLFISDLYSETDRNGEVIIKIHTPINTNTKEIVEKTIALKQSLKYLGQTNPDIVRNLYLYSIITSKGGNTRDSFHSLFPSTMNVAYNNRLNELVENDNLEISPEVFLVNNKELLPKKNTLDFDGPVSDLITVNGIVYKFNGVSYEAIGTPYSLLSIPFSNNNFGDTGVIAKIQFKTKLWAEYGAKINSNLSSNGLREVSKEEFLNLKEETRNKLIECYA